MTLRVLYLAARPRDWDALKLEQEAAEIQEKIRAANLSEAVELVPHWATRPDDLLRIFNADDDWKAVHFSGHGTEQGETVLLDDREHGYEVPKEALEAFFEKVGRKTRLVVLNACYSRVQAEWITRHVDCAVGMKQSIGDDVASAFAASFYRALGAGKSVQEAFEQGTTAIPLALSSQGDVPTVCCRPGVDPAAVVLTTGANAFRADDEWTRCAPAPTARREQDRWHVYLRGFEDNRKWTRGLYDVLVHHGYTVFMDQLAAPGTEPREERLARGLASSRRAVLVWSGRGEDLEESRAELGALRARRDADEGFDYVVVTLDPGPPELEGRYIEFCRDAEGPTGEALVDLLFALRGLPRSPEADRMVQELDARAQQARREIEGLVRSGREESAAGLCELFNARWETPAWRVSPELGCLVVEGLTRLGRELGGYTLALELLDEIAQRFPGSLRQKQLRALALARRGDEGDAAAALQLLAGLLEDHHDPETLGIYARTLMDRHARSGNRRDLKQSRDRYLEGFERSPDDTYCGINAAAKSAMMGEHDEARDLALRVRERLDALEPRDYFERATIAEASLLLGEHARAAEEYQRAIDADPEQRGSIATTWKQVRRLREHLHIPDADWAKLARVFEDLELEEGS